MSPSSQSNPRDGFDPFAAGAYLFDIDGTLLNTRDPTHYFAFRNAMREVFGFDANIDGVHVHGNTDIGILRAVAVREGIAAQTFAAGLPRVQQLMCAEVQANAHQIRADVCPAIRELLEHLQRAGKLLGIVSGNFEPIGWAKLKATGLAQFFTFGCFSDRAELREQIFANALQEVVRRLGPEARTYIVGDTPSDIRAARKVSAPVIAVATGMYPLAELAALEPDLCVTSCTELLSASQRA